MFIIKLSSSNNLRIRSPWMVITVLIWLCLGCKTPSILVTEEQRQGDFYNNQHDYEQAIVHYDNVLAASIKLGTYRNLDMEADVCRKIAHAYNVQGEFEKALVYIYSALEKDSIQGNTIEIIEDYRELGKIHLYMGAYLQGMQYLNHVLTLNEGMDQSLKGINQLSMADTYLTLSWLHTLLGDFQQGELYGLRSLNIYKNLVHKEGEMESLLQLGKIAVQNGTGSIGETYVRSSMELADNLNMNTYRHKQTLARVYENQALYEESLRLKLESIEEAKKSNNLPQIIWAHMLTGDLYMVMGDQQKAREYYQEAIVYLDSSRMSASALDASANLRAGNIDEAYGYFSEAGAEVASGIASMRLGETALEWKLWQEAEEHFIASMEHFSAAGLKDGMARTLIMRTIVNIKRNNLMEAQEYLDRANDLVLYDETRWQLYFIRGNLNEALSQPDAAIEAYISSVEIIESIRGNLTVEEYKSMFMEDKMMVYDSLIRLLMQSGNASESFYYSEKARARVFLDMLGNGRIHIRQDESSDLVEIEQRLRQEIHSLNILMQKGEMALTRGVDRNQLEKEIFDTREEYNNVIRRLKLYNKEYSSIVNLEIEETETLVSDIDPGSALLCYWIGKEELYIWMITSKGIQSRIVAIGEEEIAALVIQGRKTVGSNQHEDIYPQLYQYLIMPFEEELNAFKTVGIVPHLTLHFLPYQCLMPDADSYIIDYLNIFYTPSVNAYTLARKKELAPEEGLLAMAIGGLELLGLSGLPGTTMEVSLISSLFSEPSVAYENASTEALFKSRASHFEYLHLATHGILDPQQPMFSYMVLAPSDEEDGLLTVGEIFGLELNARLVVLSACETALGSLNRGDEIVGLSRAFLYAGSRDVVVSLWSVADEPTAYLMTQFYNNLENHSAVHSLKLAQIATREKYSNPVYWAPFQLIGTGY